MLIVILIYFTQSYFSLLTSHRSHSLKTGIVSIYTRRPPKLCAHIPAEASLRRVNLNRQAKLIQAVHFMVKLFYVQPVKRETIL